MKMLISLISVAVALIPMWIWIVVYEMVKPDGFWQKAFMSVVGLLVLGGIQIFAVVACFVFLYGVWTQCR